MIVKQGVAAIYYAAAVIRGGRVLACECDSTKNLVDDTNYAVMGRKREESRQLERL